MRSVFIFRAYYGAHLYIKRIHVRSAFTCPSKLGHACLEDILLKRLQGEREGRASYPPFVRVPGAKE